MTDLRQAAMLALDALDKLSKLGNGSQDGNSLGNTIAQEAREHLFTALEQPEQEPVALEAVYETIIQWDEGGGKRSRRELARRIVDIYTTPHAAQAAPVQEPVVFYRCNGCGHAYEQVHPTSCDCMDAGGFDRVEYFTAPPAAQPEHWDKPSASFDAWWNGGYMPPANPFDEDSIDYWAWAGWQAAQRPWVGLDDYKDWDEIDSKRGTTLDTFADGAAWAGAKLKERNT